MPLEINEESNPALSGHASSKLLKNSRSFRKPFLIGVAGGTASGKSLVCERISDEVKRASTTRRQIRSIPQDAFYKNLNGQEAQDAREGKFNFDHPSAYDLELMLKCLRDIKDGRETQIPIYDNKTNARLAEPMTIKPSDEDVILVEGILLFYFDKVRKLFDMKLFVDLDPDLRLMERILRYTEERGKDVKQILTQYENFVKPSFEEFCQPTMKYADVIIPRGADNKVAIDVIVKHIQSVAFTNDKQNDTCDSYYSPH